MLQRIADLELDPKTKDEIKELVTLLKSALGELYKEDESLISRNVNERSITFRFGLYFDAQVKKSSFRHLNVDAEYNRNKNDTKQIPSRKNGVHPDIILHERENNDKNKLVIEFKKGECLCCGKKHHADFQKLRDFTNQSGSYKYRLGAFIVLTQKEPKIKYFINGVAYDD